MTQLMVEVNLPDADIEKARQMGILSSEGMSALVKAEIKRRRSEAMARLKVAVQEISSAFKADYPDLTDEEAYVMLESWLDEPTSNEQNEDPQTA